MVKTRAKNFALVPLLLVMALVIAFPASARAAAANVVPNAGFEQTSCCSGTSAVCGWLLRPDPSGFMSLDTANVHSGSASLFLGWSGETGGMVLGSDAPMTEAEVLAIGGRSPSPNDPRRRTQGQPVLRPASNACTLLASAAGRTIGESKLAILSPCQRDHAVSAPPAKDSQTSISERSQKG
jgi:hypothetical protein